MVLALSMSEFLAAVFLFCMMLAFSICMTIIVERLEGIDELVMADMNVGDVYHSVEVFRLDYGEMEKKFKIYVYPDEKAVNFSKNIREMSFLVNNSGKIEKRLPPRRSPDLVSGFDFYPKMETKFKIYVYLDEDEDKNIANYNDTISGKYASEGYFFKNIRETSFLTNDPNQAHLFFIPISCHKLHQKVSSDEEMASNVEKHVRGLIHKYPYWNRTLGSDHFFLTCHEIDVGATQAVQLLVKNSIRVVCSPTYDSGFIPHKDVSLPLLLQPFSQPAATRNYIEKRRILGYWAGICNSEIRKTLVSLWGDDQELDIQNTTGYIPGRMEKFYTSKFCICPAGSRVTSHLITKAIHYQCVPVILADYFDLPFKDVLDWRTFSVILKESDVYRLKDILKAKAGAEFIMLHRNLLKVQPHFTWNTPPVKYDAFHMVLYDLWLRRNVIKYSTCLLPSSPSNYNFTIAI